MSAEVKRVVIQIGKREIELSVEDAKSLKEALDGMFEKATVVNVPYPVYPYGKPWSWPYYTDVICGSGSTTSWKAECKGDVQYLAINQAGL